jgi:hypothetical protein
MSSISRVDSSSRAGARTHLVGCPRVVTVGKENPIHTTPDNLA